MPDNVGYTPGTGAVVAADDIGGVLYQRVKLGVGVDGSATDVSATDPLPTFEVDASATTAFGPVTTANAVVFSTDTANETSLQFQITGSFTGSLLLQGSNNNTTWFAVQGLSYNSDVQTIDTLYAPDIVTIGVLTRYFRVVTSSDFVGTVSGVWAGRAAELAVPLTQTTLVGVDASVVVPVGGVDPTGLPRKVAVSSTGQVIPADGTLVTGTRLGASVGPIVLVDTAGYNSVALQLAGTFTGTVTFQVSNDLSTWQSVAGWPSAGGAAPVTTATAVGQWVFPAAGRWFRAQITTAGTGQPLAIAALRNFAAWQPQSSPSIAANQTVNVAQVSGTATVTSGVAGMQAVGGNIAVGSAPTSNPIPLAWDGTNTRRILTDASSGGVVLGSSTVTNGQTLARFSQTATTPAATQVKGSAGRLTQLTISNGGTVAGFLHLYNAASVTLGTTNDVHCYAVPGNVANFDIALPDGGLYFATGIGAAFTAGSTATDNTTFGSAPTLIANYAFI